MAAFFSPLSVEAIQVAHVRCRRELPCLGFGSRAAGKRIGPPSFVVGWELNLWQDLFHDKSVLIHNSLPSTETLLACLNPASCKPSLQLESGPGDIHGDVPIVNPDRHESGNHQRLHEATSRCLVTAGNKRQYNPHKDADHGLPAG